MKYSKEELGLAHKHSANNRAELQNSSKCGCFHCGKIFAPSSLGPDDWTTEDMKSWDTALCPYCWIDSVIGDSSGYPITEEFLNEMYDVWFGENSDQSDDVLDLTGSIEES